MKNSLLKYSIVALIFINATFLFSQNNSNIDSLITVINTNIEFEAYTDAEKLLDQLKKQTSYRIDSIKLKIDYSEAILFKSQGKDDLALEVLLKGLSIVKNDKSSKFIADYAYEIGEGFSKRKNYSKALVYFRLLMENSKLRNDSLQMSKGYTSLGCVFLHLFQDINDELTEETDSITQKLNRDSIQYYYDKSIAIIPKAIKHNHLRAEVYANLLVYNYYEYNFDEAEKYGLLSLAIHKEAADTLEMVRDYNLLGAVNYRKEDYTKTKAYYLSGLDLVKGKKNFEAVKYRSAFFENLAEILVMLNDYKGAYKYKKAGYKLKDSLELVSNHKKYGEYEAKYNLSEQEKLAEIEKNKRQKAEVWMYVLGISTLVLFIFLWLYSRNQKIKRENKELEFQKENLLQEQKIERVKNETQVKILNATIDGKEYERREIAGVLHDSVGALLSSAGLHLQAAKAELDDKAPEEIEKTQKIVKEAGEKIRDLSHQLISSVLLKFGLAYAIEDLCEKYSNSKLSFQSDAQNVERYKVELEIKLYHIIEELLNNIIKHSKAENATLLLKQIDGQLQVRIFDDGVGFDVNKVIKNPSGGLGLHQIEARIQMMEGVFTVKSSKDEGTRIFISVPVLEVVPS